VGAPHWVRLVRTGDRLSGSASQDGVNWKQTGTLVIRLPENVYVGLAVCSHVQGSTTTAEFRHVSVTGRSGLAEATKGGVSTVASSPVSTPAPDRSPLASPALKQSIGNGASVSVDLGSGVKMEFVRVEAGTFTMGGDVERQSDWQAEERPRHKVTISKPFYLGKYPVTVAQFSRFVDATRYQTECEKAGNRGWVVRDGKWGEHTVVNWRTPGFDQTPEHPVVLVTWNDARAFVVWASQQTGRRIGLPTEAQREWAARGPKDLEYPFGQTWDPSKANHRDQALRKSGMTDGTFSSIDDGYV
jgi:formylglycine-generating enzyme required for sulfatase activity